MESSAPTVRGSFTPDLVASKTWIIDQLSGLAPRLGTVYVLGSWFGNLGVLMHLDPRVQYDRLINVDHDRKWQAVSRRIATRMGFDDHMQYMVTDVNDLDYRQAKNPSVVINTSINNIQGQQWFDRIPSGTVVALQGRDHPNMHR